MNDLITRDLDQGLLTLTFNRPDKLNALNIAMYRQLGDLLLAAGEDPQVEAIVITGGTQCFTAGNDLRDFLDNPPTDMDSPVFRLMRVVMGLDKPLIAAVAGAAIGIGSTLLLHCDQVVVSRSAKLRMPFAPLGLCPEFGSSLLLPRVLGHARAARLLLANELLDGEQAVAWGLANELQEDGEQCLAVARQLARKLQRVPQDALRISKRLLKEGLRAELEATVQRESQLFIECLRTPEAKAALRALIKD
ncbi:1,2-epoxyphenylacetyl-CoA isomerase [compost metagenome]